MPAKAKSKSKSKKPDEVKDPSAELYAEIVKTREKLAKLEQDLVDLAEEMRAP